MLNKLKTILLSRIKNNKEEKWIEERRATCLQCNYNTINGGSLLGYRFFLATLSKLLSKLMGKEKEDILGECGLCGCSVFYKSETYEESCPHEPSKWKILEDNSIRLNIREQRKTK